MTGRILRVGVRLRIDLWAGFFADCRRRYEPVIQIHKMVAAILADHANYLVPNLCDLGDLGDAARLPDPPVPDARRVLSVGAIPAPGIGNYGNAIEQYTSLLETAMANYRLWGGDERARKAQASTGLDARFFILPDHLL